MVLFQVKIGISLIVQIYKKNRIFERLITEYMVKKEIRIDYEEYVSVEEMSDADRGLCRAAVEALEGSYAPYSHFHVGAAVRLSDGTVVKGANQENAAYPSGLCAERTAMFAAGASHPDLDMESIAIVARQDGRICSEPAAPCGACRQVMTEFGDSEVPVIFGCSKENLTKATLGELYPFDSLHELAD